MGATHRSVNGSCGTLAAGALCWLKVTVHPEAHDFVRHAHLHDPQPSSSSSAFRKLSPDERRAWHGVGKACVAPAIVLSMCLLLLWKDPTFFWMCDYQLWYSPIFEEIARSWADGEWPILSASSWATGNLAGEYQCGTFSVFHNLCIILLWKLPLTLAGKAAALSIVHLFTLSLGAFLLARAYRLPASLAVAVAVATTMNGWLITWGAAEWFVALSGFVWLPWLWWALLIAMRTRSRRVRWLLPAPFVYLLVTAGSPFAVLMMLLLCAWLGLRAWFGMKPWRNVATIAVALGLGAGLSAPAWLMLMEFTQFSDRGDWGAVIQRSWVVPWRAWLALVLPSFTTEWVGFLRKPEPHITTDMACGLALVAALVAGAVSLRGKLARALRWELGFVAVIILILSVPSVGQFRWSFRWMPLLHLVLALVGAKAMRALPPVRVAAFGVLLVAAAGAIAALTRTNSSSSFAVAQLALAVAWLAAALRLRRRVAHWATAATVALSLLATFWFLPLDQHVSKHAFRENLLQPEPLDRRRLYLNLHTYNDLFWSSVQPAGIGAVLRVANTPKSAGLRFLNGYSSFLPPGVGKLFEIHGCLKPKNIAWLVSREAEPFLETLGVDGLIFAPTAKGFARSLGPGWKLIHASVEGDVYHHESRRFTPVKALPRWPEKPDSRFALPLLEIVHDHRLRAAVKVEPVITSASGENEDTGDVVPAGSGQPSLIAFLRPYYPGYRAYLNGQELPVQHFEALFPMVELPPGARGLVILHYNPFSLRAGLALAGASVVAMLIIGLWRKRGAFE